MNGLVEKMKYWNPYLGGTLLGVLLFLSFFLTSHGLGASGGVNRIAVAVEDLVIPEHVDKTPYLAKMAGGDRDPLAHWLVWEVAGILLGRFCFRVAAWPGKGADLSRAADHNPQPLGLCLHRRHTDGLWGTHGARLHLRPGPQRWRGDFGRAAGPSCSRCSQEAMGSPGSSDAYGSRRR